MRSHVSSITLLSLAAAGALLSSCTMTPAETARATDRRAAEQNALAQELAGMTASEKKDCLNQFETNSASLKAVGGALIYRVSDKLKYVNDTGGGRQAVASGDILVTKSPTGQLCRGDIAQTVMPGSRVPSGSCALGSFTTYRK